MRDRNDEGTERKGVGGGFFLYYISKLFDGIGGMGILSKLFHLNALSIIAFSHVPLYFVIL